MAKKKVTRKRIKKITKEQKIRAAADVVENNLPDAGFVSQLLLNDLLQGVIAIGMDKGKDIAIHHLGGLASRNNKAHFIVWMLNHPRIDGNFDCRLVSAIAKTVKQSSLRWAMMIALIGAVLDTME